MVEPGGQHASERPLRPAHFELAPAQVVDEQRCMAWVDALEDLAVRIVEAGGLAQDEAADFGVAIREAVVNALRHGTCASPRRIAVSFRLTCGPALAVTVRDRGPGFDPAAVPEDRRGLRESIVGRMDRHGGRAVVHSAPGAGTEVELVIER